MLDDMLGRSVSPVFVGRQEELPRSAEAFDEARAGNATAVLLGGEAESARPGWCSASPSRPRATAPVVLYGGCVELSTEGLAYAPFTAVLRQLVTGAGHRRSPRCCPTAPSATWRGCCPSSASRTATARPTPAGPGCSSRS